MRSVCEQRESMRGEEEGGRSGAWVGGVDVGVEAGEGIETGRLVNAHM